MGFCQWDFVSGVLSLGFYQWGFVSGILSVGVSGVLTEGFCQWDFVSGVLSPARHIPQAQVAPHFSLSSSVPMEERCQPRQMSLQVSPQGWGLSCPGRGWPCPWAGSKLALISCPLSPGQTAGSLRAWPGQWLITPMFNYPDV